MKQDSSSGGYEALRGGAGLIDPVWTGRIELTGADRRSYLQGLLTNDIQALGPGRGCYAALLNAQGRMLTDMRVLELGDALLLIVPRFVTATIRDHLDRFVFTEDVRVQDVTDSRAAIGVYGPDARGVLMRAGAGIELPSDLYGSRAGRIGGIDAVIVRDDEAGLDGCLMIVDSSASSAVWRALEEAGAVAAPEEAVETVRIERGRPRFGADMDADTIPLEAGIEDRAISRTKGCYVGQEVIVRVLDRGHGRVARHLSGIAFTAGAAVLEPGARISSGDRDIGRVTSAAWSPALSRPIALGYLHRDFVEPGTHVSVGPTEGIVTELPFVHAPSS